jgi:hypothetical protein
LGSPRDLADRVRALALRQATRQAERAAENRQRFPELAQFLDELEILAGGRCRVRYLHDSVSGYTAGRPGPPGCTPFTRPKPTGKGRR